MKAIRQKELLCKVIWAYMRTLEEYDGEDFDGNKKDMIAEVKKQFGLTDKEIAEINGYGKRLHMVTAGGKEFPVICVLN